MRPSHGEISKADPKTAGVPTRNSPLSNVLQVIPVRPPGPPAVNSNWESWAGMWADLTVFDRDLTRLPPDEWLEAEVEMTIIGGEIVYRKS
jgi:hypothetical protein